MLFSTSTPGCSRGSKPRRAHTVRAGHAQQGQRWVGNVGTSYKEAGRNQSQDIRLMARKNRIFQAAFAPYEVGWRTANSSVAVKVGEEGDKISRTLHKSVLAESKQNSSQGDPNANPYQRQASQAGFGPSRGWE